MAAVLLPVQYPTLLLIPGIEWTWAVYGFYSYSSYFFSLFPPLFLLFVCWIGFILATVSLVPFGFMYLTICNAMHGT
jgi:hypothetical protein